MALPSPFFSLTRQPLSRVCAYNDTARAIASSMSDILLDVEVIDDSPDFTYTAGNSHITCNFSGYVLAMYDFTCYWVSGSTDVVVATRLYLNSSTQINGTARRIHLPAVANYSQSASCAGIVVPVSPTNTIEIQAYKVIGSANVANTLVEGVLLTLIRIG